MIKFGGEESDDSMEIIIQKKYGKHSVEKSVVNYLRNLGIEFKTDPLTK